jgi:hypothetical protein
VVETEHEETEGDPNPCSEDDADFIRPDSEQMEEAISKFMDGMEEQEHGGFKQRHTFLSKLPVPVQTKCCAMTLLQYVITGDSSTSQGAHLILSELWLPTYSCMYIQVKTSIFWYIFGFLKFRIYLGFT